MNFLYKHINKLLILLILVMLIPFFSIGLGNDEPFTMGLINNNYSEIWNLTGLDIHPPFYYVLLKIFLSVFTFWTKNIFIKILFARILSFLFFVITFTYFIKILSILKFKINIYLEFLIALVMPTALNLIPDVTSIRMYSLSIMLFSMILFYLVQFYNNDSKSNLLLTYVLTTILLYTNYVAGFIAGFYLILNVIYYAINKDIKKSIEIIFIGLCSIFSFIPWMSSMLNQFAYKQNPGSNSLILKFIIEVIFTFIIFSIPYFLNKKFNKIENILFFYFPSIIIISLFFISIIRIKTGGGMISLRYLSPVIVPYSFISTNILIHYAKDNKKIYTKLMICVTVIYCLLGTSISIYRQISRYFIPQFSFIERFNTIKKSNSSNISISKNHLNKYFWDKDDGGGGNAIYLLSINKKIDDKNYINTSVPIGNGNEKLFKAVFPNIEHYSTKKPN